MICKASLTQNRQIRDSNTVLNDIDGRVVREYYLEDDDDAGNYSVAN